VVSKALETNRISLNEINSCSSGFLERFSTADRGEYRQAAIAKLPELLRK
jgi:hypothetical protein